MNQLQGLQHPVSDIVFMKGNEVVTDSTIVAEVFNKRHADVLKSIETLSCTNEFSERNFSLAEYRDAQGKPRPKYLLKRDGLMFLVMGYTGEKAAQMKESFINEFNRMEQYIKKLQQQPKSVEDAIIYSMTELKQIKSRQDHTEEEMNKMKLLVDNELWLTEQHKGAMQRKVKQRVFELKKEGYDNASYQGIYGALKRHFGVAKYDKIPRKFYQNAMRFIAGWYPPERPSELDDYIS